VVADQQFLAEKLGVSRSTIIRWLNYLESKNALVRIPVAGKVCAYADQQFLAEKLGVSRSTIIRWLNYLESKNALVRIPVAGKVCAYALDPHEV
ncbi:HTH domain-containing protein, partial [Escherichia coli]|uniref:helix-turn-helix domain-containing protein n=1 Tax=Escherichia coli TaxID=562 RepID=UPI001494C41A